MKRQLPMIIDIETVDASDEDLLLEAELLKPAANIKDIGKKEKNLKDKNASLLTKKALLDSSPIHCVGIKLGQAMISLSLCRPTAVNIDLMIMYSNLFTLSKVPYVSMNEVLCKLHIARKPINGEAYGRFVGEKDYVSAIIYNMIDCLLTEQIYRRLV